MYIHRFIKYYRTNIPFCNHNQGPRNIFQYSQGKQAMGIYATNYRQRLDKSYILYHPMEPLIQTRTAKYTNIDRLPCGENVLLLLAIQGEFLSPKSHDKVMASPSGRGTLQLQEHPVLF